MKFFNLLAIFVLNYPSSGLQLIPLRTMAERTSEKLMDVVADGAWRLLQHYVCRGYKNSQRGSGVGGIHTRHNAHQLYPVHPLKEHTSEQQAEERKPSVVIKMISPAQATLEQAQSELKKQKRGRRNPTRNNAHQLYPVHPLKEHTGEQQAEERKEKPSVVIKMISPAQATLEQAQSELKKQNKQKRGRRNPEST